MCARGRRVTGPGEHSRFTNEKVFRNGGFSMKLYFPGNRGSTVVNILNLVSLPSLLNVKYDMRTLIGYTIKIAVNVDKIC